MTDSVALKERGAFDRVDLALAVLVGAAALAIYVRTLALGVLPSDSGEFQVLGYLPAHAHNPGYWVYLLMVKAFTWLPFGDVAYRVSLFSAVMAALTVSCTYLAGKLLANQPLGRYVWRPGINALSALLVAIHDCRGLHSRHSLCGWDPGFAAGLGPHAAQQPALLGRPARRVEPRRARHGGAAGAGSGFVHRVWQA